MYVISYFASRARLVVRVSTSSPRPVDGGVDEREHENVPRHRLHSSPIMRASTTVGSALQRAGSGRASSRTNSNGPLARASSTGAEIAKGDGFVVPEGCQLAVFASG